MDMNVKELKPQLGNVPVDQNNMNTKKLYLVLLELERGDTIAGIFDDSNIALEYAEDLAKKKLDKTYLRKLNLPGYLLCLGCEDVGNVNVRELVLNYMPDR